MARASIMETKRSWTNDERLETGEPKLSDVLKIEPSSKVVLKPNNRINVVVTFKPTSRMRPFSAKVALQTSSTILPMFLVRGSCVGAEFHLNRTHIPFGTIVQGCVEESKVILMNTGDLGSRFVNCLPFTRSLKPYDSSLLTKLDVWRWFRSPFFNNVRRTRIETETMIFMSFLEYLVCKSQQLAKWFLKSPKWELPSDLQKLTKIFERYTYFEGVHCLRNSYFNESIRARETLRITRELIFLIRGTTSRM